MLGLPFLLTCANEAACALIVQQVFTRIHISAQQMDRLAARLWH